MKTIVFTFGRFSPPTKGHQRLIEKVVEVANGLNADHCVFVSQTRNKDNPLKWAFKRNILKLAVPDANINGNLGIKTPFEALQMLAINYSKIIFVVGEDRVADFTTRMTPYAKEWKVAEFEVISAGARDPESTGVEGISASKLRRYVAENKENEFLEGMPDTLSNFMKFIVFDKIKESVYNS